MGVVVAFEDKATPGGSIDGIVSLTQQDMAKVNATILSRTGSEVTMIPEVANHLISSGGKRLRPMLTLATAQLAGYPGEGHVKLAASVEFMHTATLLHDDVVDESDMRRGKPAARMVWGNEASVLVGDFLLGQAFKMMVEVGSHAGTRHPFQRGGASSPRARWRSSPPPRTSRRRRTTISPSSAARLPNSSPQPARSARSSPSARATSRLPAAPSE